MRNLRGNLTIPLRNIIDETNPKTQIHAVVFIGVARGNTRRKLLYTKATFDWKTTKLLSEKYVSQTSCSEKFSPPIFHY